MLFYTLPFSILMLDNSWDLLFVSLIDSQLYKETVCSFWNGWSIFAFMCIISPHSPSYPGNVFSFHSQWPFSFLSPEGTLRHLFPPYSIPKSKRSHYLDMCVNTFGLCLIIQLFPGLNLENKFQDKPIACEGLVFILIGQYLCITSY